MGYPLTDFSPSARSNGQTIDASHINDLQNEVSAVVSALRGTITHSLSFAGASLNVTNPSTFTTRPVTPPPDAALVYMASTTTLGSSGASTLAWTAQSFLTNSSVHSTSSNPSRLTPQSTGIYQFVGQITGEPTTGAVLAVFLRDSSAAVIGGVRTLVSSVATRMQVTAYKRFDVVGGYVVVDVQPGGYSTLSLSSGVENTWFAMHKL